MKKEEKCQDINSKLLEPQYIIFIVIDALRARNLSCYGYAKLTSPNIDNLAKEGILFEDAYATINATDPSLTTIFSGMYPFSHGILNHGMRISEKEIQFFLKSRIRLLPEILRLEGYTTFAIDFLGRWHKKGYDYYSGIQQNKFFQGGLATKKHPKVNKLLNSGKLVIKKLPWENIQFFISNVYNKFFTVKPKYDDAKSITERAIEIVKENLNKEFFLFLHYWDTHGPYDVPKNYTKRFYEKGGEKTKVVLSRFNNPEGREIFKRRMRNAKTVNEIVSRYNGAINFVDHEIGRLVRTLEEYGVLDETLIILTSDHGESLTEHGIYFDHHGLYDVSIHVPLIIRYPKKFPNNKRITGFVQHVDLAPTILDLLGIRTHNDFDGKSLMPLIYGKVKQLRSEVYIEEADAQRKRAIRNENYKYIYSLTGEKNICRLCGYAHGDAEELFNLKHDPDETQNIADENPEIVEELKSRLIKWIKCLEYKKFKKEKGMIKERITKLKSSGKI